MYPLHIYPDPCPPDKSKSKSNADPTRVSTFVASCCMNYRGFIPNIPSSPLPPPRAWTSLGLLPSTPSSQQHSLASILNSSTGFHPSSFWVKEISHRTQTLHNLSHLQTSLFSVVFYGNTPLVEVYWQNTLVSSEYKPPPSTSFICLKKKKKLNKQCLSKLSFLLAVRNLSWKCYEQIRRLTELQEEQTFLCVLMTR